VIFFQNGPEFLIFVFFFNQCKAYFNEKTSIFCFRQL